MNEYLESSLKVNINDLNTYTNGDYGIEKGVKRVEDLDNNLLLLKDDLELHNIFEDKTIYNLFKLHMEIFKLEYQNDNYNIQEIEAQIEKKKKEINKVKKEFKKKYNSKTADIILRELKRGRITFKQLSFLLYLDDACSTDFTKKIINYIRDNNLTIIAYMRGEEYQPYCIGVNGDDPNMNLDVLKYTVKDKLKYECYYINIKNYTHGTGADIKDLKRAGFYVSRKQHDNDHASFRKINRDYDAWVNTYYLWKSYNDLTENSSHYNDIYIYNNNYPHNGVMDVPTVAGMSKRGEKSARVFNKVLETINDCEKEFNDNDANEPQKLNKSIIMCGVSNGIIHMLKNLKFLDKTNIDENTTFNYFFESIPSFGYITADPKEDTAKFFIDAVLNNAELFYKITAINIDTDLSQKYHPYKAVYRFLEGVYKYFVYDDKVSIEQMKTFHDKLVLNYTLQDISEQIYNNALKKKEKWQNLSEEDKIKQTELEGIIFAAYLLLCLTIIGAFLLYPMKKLQKKQNDKKYLNKIKIDTPDYLNEDKNIDNSEIDEIEQNNSTQLSAQ